MIEAIACGCPVVAFAQGAAPEIVVQGKTGYLVEDLDAMAHAIKRIDEIDRAGVCRYAERYFSARAMAESYLGIYQQIIAGHTLTRTTEPLEHVALPAVKAAYGALSA
jgi:glycosyltransferase involved in cell wall biosynthesis